MGKHISSIELSPTLTLSTCTDGLWLYDTTRGMNLSMRAKTETEAFVEALDYYQGRLAEVEKAHAELQGMVEKFVQGLPEELLP